MIVYIVTNPELGWDCVCGVFETKKEAIECCAKYDGVKVDDWKEDNSMCVIHSETLRLKTEIRDQKINEVLK